MVAVAVGGEKCNCDGMSQNCGHIFWVSLKSDDLMGLGWSKDEVPFINGATT